MYISICTIWDILSASSRRVPEALVIVRCGAVFEVGLRVVDPSKRLAQYNGFHGNACGTCISQVGHARVSMLERSWPRGESLPLYMVATVDRGRIARVITLLRVYIYIYTVYSSLMREGSRLRDFSRDQSAMIYFLSDDAYRPFLFRSEATDWNK